MVEFTKSIPSVEVKKLFTKLTVILAFLMCLHPLALSAQETTAFPGIPLNSRTLRVQEQADEVYERTDYKRAFFIYRNELVPIGDKYGQYMVGFMYLTGKGVPEDRVAASAWYRLAAERGTKEFERARDRLLNTLDADQQAQSGLLFIELRKNYGDLVVLMKALRRDYKELQKRTGSRLSSDASPVAVVDPNRPGSSRSGSEYYGQIERQIKARLDYIAAHTNIEISSTDAESVRIDLIEAQLAEHLNTIN